MLLAGDAADALAELHRPLEPIRLPGLAGSDVENLVQHLVGAEHASRIARSIHRRSGGNPLFVGELVRLVAIEPGRGTSLPARIRAVIERRLAAVAPRSVEVLRAAAVDGVQVVQEAAGVSRAEVLDAIDDGVRAHLLSPTGGAEYGFHHALMREVLYDQLPLAERARIHRVSPKHSRRVRSPILH